ncbi:MAG: exodeoxyribonuclease VII large subunit [Clostridia bacterium]|nr:exodeoxyribonuclease VII large subunit [Clostridia bacterium]
MSSNFFESKSVLPQNSDAISVSELNFYAEKLLSSDRVLKNVTVEGEISGFKRYYTSGHCYFSLKDDASSVRCVMFKGYADGLNFSPKDGMRVIISGHATLYSKEGQFQLYAQSMHGVGDGELYLAFLQMKAKLESEGLFDAEHKKPLPYLPKTVGVVTSRSGAVLHDIANVIKRRFPTMNIILSPCSVQGKDAPREIISALEILDKSGLADVIILGRGGGSMEDLQCFNDESLARAVFACKTPVISAVGHETDYSVTDFVADMRAPTPSAAAELAVPIFDEICGSLDRYAVQIKSYVTDVFLQNERQLNLTAQTLTNPENMINMYELRLSQMGQGICDTVQMRLTAAETELEKHIVTTEAFSPAGTLLRGFAAVRDKDGSIISTAKRLREEKTGTITFSDGDVDIGVL